MPGGRTNATKVIGAPYRRPEASAGGGPTCKASANEWLARVTVALHGHLRDAGREPAASPWALVLDTERCDTILALDEAGAIPKRRCVVPNPDAAVCRAARTHGAHAVEATSHAVLVPDGPVHPLLRAAAAARPREPPTRSRVSPTRVAARLDASGSTTAAACRAAAVVDDAKTSAPSSPPRTPPTRGSHLTRCSR